MKKLSIYFIISFLLTLLVGCTVDLTDRNAYFGYNNRPVIEYTLYPPGQVIWHNPLCDQVYFEYPNPYINHSWYRYNGFTHPYRYKHIIDYNVKQSIDYNDFRDGKTKVVRPRTFGPGRGGAFNTNTPKSSNKRTEVRTGHVVIKADVIRRVGNTNVRETKTITVPNTRPGTPNVSKPSTGSGSQRSATRR